MVSPKMAVNHRLHQLQLPPLLSHWSLDGAALCSPNPLFSPFMSLGSVFCLHVLIAVTIHTVLSSAWHRTTKRCGSSTAQRTLTSHCSVTGSPYHLHSMGHGTMKKGGYADFLPSPHSLLPALATAVASLQIPM